MILYYRAHHSTASGKHSAAELLTILIEVNRIRFYLKNESKLIKNVPALLSQLQVWSAINQIFIVNMDGHKWFPSGLLMWNRLFINLITNTKYWTRWTYGARATINKLKPKNTFIYLQYFLLLFLTNLCWNNIFRNVWGWGCAFLSLSNDDGDKKVSLDFYYAGAVEREQHLG